MKKRIALLLALVMAFCYIGGGYSETDVTPEEQDEWIWPEPEPAPEELQESEEDMASLGASEFRANGLDYTINDPNNANEFSASVAYSAGQYVYYQGILYRFTADHAAGAWNSAHVTQAKLGQDVSDLKSAIGNTTISKNIMGNGEDIAYAIDVKPGEKITISTKDGSNFLPDGNYIYLKSENRGNVNYFSLPTNASQKTITVPTTGNPVKYATLRYKSPVDLMVAKSATALPYEPYVPNYLEIASEYSDKVMGTEIYPEIMNGTTENTGNAKTVNTWYVEMTEGDVIEVVNNIALQASGNRFVYACAWYDENKTRIINSDIGFKSPTKGVFIAPAGVSFVRVNIAEYASDDTQATLRYTNFPNFQDFKLIVSKKNSLYADYNSQKKPNDQIKKYILGDYFIPSIFTNGTFANPSNPNLIRCDEYIEVNPGDEMFIYISRPVDADGYEYIYDSYDIYDSEKTRILRAESSPIYRPITIPENGKYIRIVLGERNYQKDLPYVLRATMFTEGDVIVAKNSRFLKNIADDEGYTRLSNPYLRNADRHNMLTSAVRLGVHISNTYQDFAVLEVTDSHSDNVACRNAVDMANGFDQICALIHCGDYCASHALNFNDLVYADMLKCKKPFYFVIGNHDVGNTKTKAYCLTNAEAYTRYIAPMVDAGLLTGSEYSEGKCYYYHDFTDKNIRLICVYEYDDPNDLNPDNETVYKITRGMSVISKQQAQWFCETLKNTPSGYSVIVATHAPYSQRANCIVGLKFNQPARVDGQGNANLYSTDFWADAVNAYVNRSSNYVCDMICTGDAEYLNTNDGKYYSFSYDFSSAVGGFMCFIGGHVHQDCVWQHTVYTWQKQITPIDANTINYLQNEGNDIRRTFYDSPSKDSLTAIGFDTQNKKLRLVKLGVNVTDKMEPRDYECIDCQHDYFTEN